MSGTCSRCGAPIVLDMDAEPMYSDPRIADLERQLAEAKAEIDAMRPMVEACKARPQQNSDHDAEVAAKALDEIAEKIMPKNPEHDWTEYARIKASCAMLAKDKAAEYRAKAGRKE